MKNKGARRNKNILRNLITNLILIVLSILVIVFFSEFIIFRLVLPATDLPRNQFVDGTIKYIPNQRGVFRRSNDYQTIYRINAAGWNSGHTQYVRARSHKYRIAIIGDSYVEALMVDYRHSLAEQLENKLGSDKFEVYRFGISGAPLSQYLQIFRKEVIKYSPDLVVIVLVQNDFDESYQFVPGRYTSSFLKINVKDGKILGEIPPKEYKETLSENLVRSSAIFRYFVFNRGVDIDNIRRLIFRPQKAMVYKANIDVTNLDQKMRNNEKVTEYLMGQIKKLTILHNLKLLFVMDGDRYSIYCGESSGIVLSLNKMAHDIANRDNIPFIDLQSIFQQDYQKNHSKFNYVHDNHWNQYGHKIVAETIFKYLVQQNIAQGN